MLSQGLASTLTTIMKWSVKLGRYFGIDVYIHLTFLLLLAFVGITQWLAVRNIGAAVGSILFFLSVFLCVLLHEFGHALAARQYGIRTRDIIMLPIGGVARLGRMPEKPTQELWVALAGPLVNVVIAGGLFLGLNLRGIWDSFGSISAANGNWIERLFAINLFLVVFNLLPAFPMDGGRVLRALLAMRMPYARATRAAASVGQAMAVLFGFVGLFVNPMLLLIALFVWIGASQEASAVEMKSAFSGANVRDAMLTRFRDLAPTATLGEAARQLLAGSQQDFPIVQNGEVLGVLLRKDLIRALQEGGEQALVESVMTRGIKPVQADDLLDSALSGGDVEQQTAIPVFRGTEFVGLLTAENVGEFYMIRSALARRSPVRGDAPPAIVPPVQSYPRTAGA